MGRLFPGIYVPTEFKTEILGCGVSMSLLGERGFSLRKTHPNVYRVKFLVKKTKDVRRM